jgi:hypothetical protein
MQMTKHANIMLINLIRIAEHQLSACELPDSRNSEISTDWLYIKLMKWALWEERTWEDIIKINIKMGYV